MDNTIRIIRGTTAYVNIQLKDEDGGIYRLADGEVLRFGVKEGVQFDEYKLLKELTEENVNAAGDGYMLTFLPADTEGLQCRAYVYDVGLQAGLDYFNAIPCASFVVAPNVTAREV